MWTYHMPQGRGFDKPHIWKSGDGWTAFYKFKTWHSKRSAADAYWCLMSIKV